MAFRDELACERIVILFCVSVNELSRVVHKKGVLLRIRAGQAHLPNLELIRVELVISAGTAFKVKAIEKLLESLRSGRWACPRSYGSTMQQGRRIAGLAEISLISWDGGNLKRYLKTKPRTPKKTMGADLPQDRRPCLYLSSPMEN